MATKLRPMGTLDSFLGTNQPIQVTRSRLPAKCSEEELQAFMKAYKGAQVGSSSLGGAGVPLRAFLCDVLHVHGITMRRLWDLSCALRTTKQSMFEVYNLARNPYELAKESPPLITFDSCVALQRKYKFQAKPTDIAGALVVDRLYNLVSGGNCPYVPTHKLEAALRDCDAEYAASMREAVRAEIVTQRLSGKMVSTTRSLWKKMRYIETATAELAAESADSDGTETWDDNLLKYCGGVSFNAQQKDAFMGVYNHSALAITGGPGTGKTTTVAAMNRAMAAQGTVVFNLAFSGKAVKVLRDRLPERAHCYTLHRFLRVIVHECDEVDFDGSIIICDEASMVDIILFDELLRHVDSTQSRLVLVGDPQQLPPVGLGSPFNDLIGGIRDGTAALPHVELVTTNRYAADMAEFVNNINHHKWTPPASVKHYELPPLPTSREGTDAAWGHTSLELKGILVELLEQNPDLRDLSKTMFLSPQHEYACGTKASSGWLQSILNPDGTVLDDCSSKYGRTTAPFREGDAVVRTVNSYGNDSSGGNVDHYNGDDGTIRRSPKRGKYIIEYQDGGTEELRGQHVRDDFDLGYVRTIHKSQGGEVDNIVVLGPTTCHGMWRRPGGRRLLTVAVSRAKKAVYLLGHLTSIKECLLTPDEVQIGRMFSS